MSSPILPTVVFTALPTTLDAQQRLLQGLSAYSIFAQPQSVSSVFDAYQLVADERQVLSPATMSSLLDRVLSPTIAGIASAPVLPEVKPAEFFFGAPSVFRPSHRIAKGEPRKVELPVKANAGTGANSLPADLLDDEALTGVIEQELVRLRLAFEQVRASMMDAQADDWRNVLDVLERKKSFWEDERQKLQEAFGSHKRRYEIDIGLGESILLDQVRRSLAALFVEEELHQEESEREDGRVRGLRSRLFTRGEIQTESGSVVSALVNRDVGFGPNLTLRSHQTDTIRLFRGLLKRVMELSRAGAPIADNLIRGTVAMPQGGGKTRTMVASFAVAIQLGLFDARNGDKFIVLNHTDQIHGQNMKVMGLLNDYFVAKFGRPLRVSEYKADVKDCSGDVVIVSVPSVNSDSRRHRFEKSLRAALGKKGSVPVAALDEVHHSDLAQERQDSWNKLVETIRLASPGCFRLGFTATPTPKDRPFIRIRDLDLMRAGVTPRTYLVKVLGTDLKRLKVPRDGNDFSPRELSSTLLDEHDRNKRLFAAVEQQGLKWETPSPSGRDRLKPTLYFGVDLAHARMMAEDYLDYFQQKGDGLRWRRLALLGTDRGRIASGDLEKALNDYREGKIDQVTVVVSGLTSMTVRRMILEAAELGEIEAFFSVDLWYEGADLYMLTHIAGSRPTFSPYKKGQERGRPNRRSPKDVTPQGEILSDEPKIIFDVIDHYEDFDRALVSYGQVMNVRGYYEAKSGQVFDAAVGRILDKVDRLGKSVERTPFEPKLVPITEKDHPTTARKPAEPDWESLSKYLQGVLAESYGGETDAMAEDLGVAPEDLEKLLSGRDWEQRYDFLRRLATLLYLDRDAFVEIYNESRGVRDEALSEADLAFASEALGAYEERAGKSAELGVVVEGDAGWGRQKILLSAYTVGTLGRRTISERYWVQLLQAILVSFGIEARQETGDAGRREEARLKHESLMAYLFARRGWKAELGTARGRLLNAARRALTAQAGGRLSVFHGIEGISKRWASRDVIPLHHWLNGRTLVYSRGRSAKAHYEEIRSLMTGLGVARSLVDDLIVRAVFEEEGWSLEPVDAQGRLLFEARKKVALGSGGRLQHDHGIADVPLQVETSVLTCWLRTGKIDFAVRNTRREFYRQVKKLLEGFGMPRAEIRDLIEKAVFEAEGWDRKRATAGQRLLLEARRLTAFEFGGRLHTEHGIPGVKDQKTEGSPISVWLATGAVDYSRKVPPHVFYAQVRALLRFFHPNSEKHDGLVTAAVYEEQGWKGEPDTPLGRLLKRVRGETALQFGGRLPANTGFEGVSQQNWDYVYKGKEVAAAPLTRWIRGEEIVFSRTLTQENFARQVRALCAGLGIDGDIVERALQKAA